MTEEFSLKWNDYQSNWKQSLSDLRTDSDLADVTLISEDKVKFSAHKVLLSSCSNVFKFILKGSSNANPLIYLSGVFSVDLGFILDYIYHGEVNLFQEQLESFLESARKLEVEGLLGGHGDHQSKAECLLDMNNDIYIQDPTEDKQIVKMEKRLPRTPMNITKFDVSSMTSEEIEEKKDELFEKRDGIWRCLACEHTCTSDKAQMKRHVETHLEGISYTCTLCIKEFRSKHSLTNHNSKSHRFV